MSEETVRKILQVMMTADGECSFCAARLIRQFVEIFPPPAHSTVKRIANEVWTSAGYTQDGWETI